LLRWGRRDVLIFFWQRIKAVVRTDKVVYHAIHGGVLREHVRGRFRWCNIVRNLIIGRDTVMDHLSDIISNNRYSIRRLVTGDTIGE
jgi:hypothetical protein